MCVGVHVMFECVCGCVRGVHVRCEWVCGCACHV